MTNKEQLIAAAVTEDFMSPYALAGIESSLRKVKVPPQKLYGYIRQGYLVATRNSTGKLQVSRDAAVQYLTRQVKN